MSPDVYRSVYQVLPWWSLMVYSLCFVIGRAVMGSWSSRHGELYTPEVEKTELYLYRSDIGAGNKTQSMYMYLF